MPPPIFTENRIIPPSEKSHFSASLSEGFPNVPGHVGIQTQSVCKGSHGPSDGAFAAERAESGTPGGVQKGAKIGPILGLFDPPNRGENSPKNNPGGPCGYFNK